MSIQFGDNLKIVAGIAENDAIAAKFASHLEELFGVLDPAAIGADYARAIENNDHAAAVKACAEYFRNRADIAAETGLSAEGVYNIDEAERSAAGVFTVVDITWAFPNGEVDFLFNPTAVNGPLNREWVWQFGRHGYWMDLARTYAGTGNEKYAAVFKKHLLKWLAQAEAGSPETWRTIECGLRLGGPWLIAFDGFRKSRTLDDVTLLLMIASMHRQAAYLTEHFSGGNWLMMELSGVYSFSAVFPELIDSAERVRNVERRITGDVCAQVLPDGMQYELSPDYHYVTLVNALKFCVLAKNLGHDVDPGLLEKVKNMVNAAILLSTPAFTQPCTNDCYKLKTSMYVGKEVSELFGELPEYRYVLSERAEGAPPAGETASAFLPYAGFAAMRSDWGADATYLCFDVGPLGAGHMHQDMLNIIVFKGKQQLIYDDGGGQYDQSEFRRYALSGYAHNTVLVDGLAQSRSGPRAPGTIIDAGWTTNAVFDYAAATYTGTFGTGTPATHKREVRFCKPGFFVVADTLTSVDGNAHDYEILFQLDTTVVKELSGFANGVISGYGGRYEIALIPLDPQAAVLKCVSGATDPIRGWYNGRNGQTLHKATTVSRTVKNAENCRFVTLLFPVRSGAPLPEITDNGDGTVSVSFEGKEYCVDLSHLDR